MSNDYSTLYPKAGSGANADAGSDPNAPAYAGPPAAGVGFHYPSSPDFNTLHPPVVDTGGGYVRVNGEIMKKEDFDKKQKQLQAQYDAAHGTSSSSVLPQSSELSLLQDKFTSGGYGRGPAAEAAFHDELKAYGYDDKTSQLIVDANAKAAKLQIDPGRLQTAYEHGQIKSRGELMSQLTAAGMPQDQVNIFADLADDGKNEYQRTHKLDVANDANTLTGIDQQTRKNAFDQAHLMSNGSGGNDEFNKTPSDNLILAGYKGGDYDRNMAKAKLMNQGLYTDQDAETLLHSADQPAPAAGQQAPARSQSFGSSGSVNAAGGNTVTHPQARQTVNDFRSNFSANLKALGPAVTPAARAWAMNNQDMFFTPGSDSSAVGASQIQNLYEGMGTAGGRAGYSKQGGAIQARAL